MSRADARWVRDARPAIAAISSAGGLDVAMLGRGFAWLDTGTTKHWWKPAISCKFPTATTAVSVVGPSFACHGIEEHRPDLMRYDSATIFVTGGAGFIGPAVIRQLLGHTRPFL